MNTTLRSLLDKMNGSIEVDAERVRVRDKNTLRVRDIDLLAREAVFAAGETRNWARWLIWETAQTLDIRPASIHELYVARGFERVPASFAVPAINLRALAYDSARAAFSAAIKARVGALIFELTRNEMVDTAQRPAEYTSVVLAAAIKEGFRGPVFLQGDHFQLLAERYRKDTDAELSALRRLIDESLRAGFYNFDLDTSTVVDMTRSTPAEQQHHNYELTALLTDYIRVHQPHNVIVAIGGEIGEGGQRNSDIHELRAYLDGCARAIRHKPGICKVAVMAGTAQGGAFAPDGTPIAPPVDFALLRALSDAARKEYGLGGVAQHGASTVPDEMFAEFARNGALEVKLATQLQNLVLDNLPDELRADMQAWTIKSLAGERKSGVSDETFLHRHRRKSIGPFKEQMWALTEFERGNIRALLERRFANLFNRLGVADTRDMAGTFVSQPEIHKSPQDFSDHPAPITPEQE